jgi:tetratricopeptide (TPR) repeat protein
MADLKEETTVDNTDTNPVEETVEETRKPIDPNLEGIQLYYEKNKKMINYVGGGLALLIGALCFFKLYYLPEQEKEAANEIFWAESLFEKDSFNLALKGGAMVMSADGQKQMKGFEQVADEYSMTKTGSLANYYAGICYLRTGKFEQAIEFLDKYNGSDDVIAPIAIGAMGDCHMELNRQDEAVKYYLKAADKSNNIFTTPFYLKKAGFVYELKAQYSDALNVYERIQKEFPKSTESAEIEKDIAKVKALGNL